MGEVTMTDGTTRPPQFVEVAVVASIDHVMRSVRRDEVGRGIAFSKRTTGSKIALTDRTRCPPQFVEVADH